MISINNFEQELSEAQLDKGKAYFKTGYVDNLEQVDTEWTAEVEGSDIYYVEVTLSKKNEITRSDCDCPHDAQYCKHIIAVLYAIKNEIKTISINPDKKLNRDVFEAILQKVTQTEYQGFIKEFAKKNKDFKTAFELYFAAKDDRIDIADKYYKIIKNIISKHSSRGFIEYNQANKFSDAIFKIIAEAEKLADKNNPKDAFLIAQALLKQVTSTIEYSDDSNGSIGNCIDETIELIANLAKKEIVAIELKELIFEFLSAELRNKIYFDYGDFAYGLLNIYKTLALLLGKHKEYLFLLEKLKEGHKTNSHLSNFIVKATIKFYEEIGQPKMAEKLIETNMEIVEIRENIVKLAIENKDYAKAKVLVNEGIEIALKKEHAGTVSNWKKRLLDIAYLENDKKTIRDITRFFAFHKGVNVDYYRQWKKTFKPEEWLIEIESLIANAITKITSAWNKNKMFWRSANPPLLSELGLIYIEENYLDRLLELVRIENNLETTLYYQTYLLKIYAKELIAIYLPAIQNYADRANDRTTYANLVKHMKKIIKDIPESKSEIIALGYLLKSKYSIKPRRPAMLEELEKLFK
jgi:SWIM zinc finger